MERREKIKNKVVVQTAHRKRVLRIEKHTWNDNNTANVYITQH
jgi:hypothetical protein